MPNASTWASYFQEHAQLRLGPEQRLPNGIAWRLVTDTHSTIAMPRLTWMRDRRRLRTANRLLEQIHGGEMLLDAWNREENWRATSHDYIRNNPTFFQADVGLTLAGGRLMSLFSGGWYPSGGSSSPSFLRGLTFDLDAATVTHVSFCDARHYGRDGDTPRTYRFRYGSLLDLCDAADYRRFVSLVREIDDARPARHLPPEAVERRGEGCWRENPDQPLVREDQEYVLYLTFAGLAVHVADEQCPDERRPDNPVIVPWRRLAPLMLPGPWKDELLALH